jgi:hypothetical protein
MGDGTALLAGMDSAKLPFLGNHLIYLRATLSLLEKMFFFYLNIVHLNSVFSGKEYAVSFSFLFIVSTISTVLVYVSDS